jgi:elongation factor P
MFGIACVFARRSVAASLMATRGLKEKASKAVKPRALLVVDDIPHRVTKITQGKRGKGGGFVKATLKNLSTGFSHESTYTSDEQVEIANMDISTAQFSWDDGVELVFLDTSTFDEIRVGKGDIDNAKFLVEGSEARLIRFRNKVIGVDLPKVCEFEVVSVDSSATWQGNQPATLNSGAVVMVPMFIKEGQRIRVNTEDANYVEKA